MPGLTILLILQLPMSEQVSVYSLCKIGFRIIVDTHTHRATDRRTDALHTHTHDRMRGNGHTGEEQGTSSTAFGDKRFNEQLIRNATA